MTINKISDIVTGLENAKKVIEAISENKVTPEIVNLANQIPRELFSGTMSNIIGMIAGSFGDIKAATELAEEEMKRDLNIS
jgi:hypothetical protein